MTREEAKQALAATFCFKRVGSHIALREIGLIEATLTHEAKRLEAPSIVVYPEFHPSRLS